MATPTIPNGEEYFFPIIYEGNGAGQRVGKFVPFTDNGTIANSCIFNDDDSPELSRTPSSETNRDTFTLSFWIKRCNIGSLQLIFQHGANANNCTQFSFDSSDRLQYQQVDGGSNTDSLVTNRTFEDTSKFYHILLAVDTTQATEANRVRMYVDGDEITSWSTANYPTQNTDTDVNTTTEFSIGRQLSGTAYSPDCYFAEMNFVDGTQHTPSTFGITDTSTNRWIPKTLTGITYGTNGFRLQFQDSSSLGDDTSGNTNDFTATNLASTDQTTSSPTQNFNTFASFNSGTSATDGNLIVSTGTTNGAAQAVAQSGFGVATGKWYWEVKITTTGAGLWGWKDDGSAGGSQASTSGTQGGGNFSGALSTGASGQYSAGSWFIDHRYTEEVNYTTVSTNDVLMFAMDLDSGKGYCGKNGTWFNSANPANGTGAIGGCHRANGINKFYPCAVRSDSNSVGEFNFGQKSFAHTPPTGFSTLQQDNLPETAKGISGLVWTKNRDAADNHQLYDSSRGKQLVLASNTDGIESTVVDGLQKFLKGGQQIEDSDAINTAGESFVSWNWVANGGTTASNTDGSIASTVQANTTAGFSIVKYVGTGANATVGHGLSSAPEWVMTRIRNAGSVAGFAVGCTADPSGFNNFLYLNETTASTASAATWNNTAPTNSVFSVGTSEIGNYNGYNMLAYCWHSVDGFSKFGFFKGNGSTDGPMIYTGFRPAWLLIKRTDSSTGGNWSIIDSTRYPANPIGPPLLADSTDAESGLSSITMDLLSNGFKIRNTLNSNNNSSGTYIYMAFASNPFVGDGTSPVTAR